MSHRTKLQKLLKQSGFVLVRSKNHFVYKNETGRTVIVPNHNKMNELTFRSIMKQIKSVSL